MAFLIPDRARTDNGLVIKEKIIPWGAVWPKTVYNAVGKVQFAKGSLYKADRKLSGGTGKVQYVTIHNTAAIQTAVGITMAEQYTRATWPNANMKDARVHYYIDDKDCWQLLREDEVGWHAADGKGPGNETSLAVEIIMDGSGSLRDERAEDRGALLAAILLKRHGLSIDRLTTHKHWYSKKNCPAYILPHWSKFQKKVEIYLKQLNATAAVTDAAVKNVGTSGSKQKTAIHKGDLVSIAKGAVYTTGSAVPGWVQTQKWYVKEEPVGSRVIIDQNELGAYSICSPIDQKYLTVVKPAVFAPYLVKANVTKLTVYKQPNIHSGIAGVITDRGTYTITAENGTGSNRFGKLKSGIGWILLNQVKKC